MGVRPMALVMSFARRRRGGFTGWRAFSDSSRFSRVSRVARPRASCGIRLSAVEFDMAQPSVSATLLPCSFNNISFDGQFHNILCCMQGMYATPRFVPRGLRAYGPRSPRRISCRRSGNLSIARVISRTSHGDGLRCFTCPSLSMRTRENPRGCKVMRHELPALGSLSAMTTTSRSINAAGLRSSMRICSTNAGSSGVSAKTTTTRDFHWKSAGAVPIAGCIGNSGSMATGGVRALSSGECALAVSAPLCRSRDGVVTNTSGGGSDLPGPIAASAKAARTKFTRMNISPYPEYRVLRGRRKDGS